jgi:hypothetical protein
LRVFIIEILRLLDGIQDKTARETVRRHLAECLTEYPALRNLPF